MLTTLWFTILMQVLDWATTSIFLLKDYAYEVNPLMRFVMSFGKNFWESSLLLLFVKLVLVYGAWEIVKVKNIQQVMKYINIAYSVLVVWNIGVIVFSYIRG